MSDHQAWNDLIPFYCSGEISEEERSGLEAHLAECPACRADVAFWKAIASEVKAGAEPAVPGPAPIEGALARIASGRRPKKTSRLRLAAGLLCGQAAILRGEIWISAAALMGLCFAASLIIGKPDALRLMAPLIAAASLAVIGGPWNDPAFELSQSTPVSPGKIVLARATLVFGYNLALAAAADVLLSAVLPEGIPLDLVRDGLAPMAFLSALALLLSLWIGTTNAVAAAALVWILRIIPTGLVRRMAETLDAPALSAASSVYRSLWLRPGPLLVLAAILILAAVRRIDRFGRGRTLSRRTFS